MFKVLCTSTLLVLYTSVAVAGSIGGYHYEKPTVSLRLVSGPANLGHGHSFGPIPTAQPIPPVPALPPLPTPRPKGKIVQTQTLYQSHPVATTNTLPSSYLFSEGTAIGKIAQQYLSPGLQSPAAPSAPSFSLPSAPSAAIGSTLHTAPAPNQPIRVPFGKQAIISFPPEVDGQSGFEASARQLKQYAVIEIIDNDIEQNTQPFMNSSPFFDSYRAQIGATGTGAAPEPFGGIQLGTRSSAALLGQQRSAAQVSGNDAVALGSGGLGFIRLANGNIYLGSGSLGYVSGQQHSQEINEARTRSGANQPDALHFGHGPLGNPTRPNRFVYRFK